MESFGHKMFISSQPYWSLKTKKLIEKSERAVPLPGLNFV